jgi:hypothetical protein
MIELFMVCGAWILCAVEQEPGEASQRTEQFFHVGSGCQHRVETLQLADA